MTYRASKGDYLLWLNEFIDALEQWRGVVRQHYTSVGSDGEAIAHERTVRT